MKKLDEKHAGEVALQILQYRYSRRGVELQSRKLDEMLGTLAKKSGFSDDELRSFFLNKIVPATLKACDSGKHTKGWATLEDKPFDSKDVTPNEAKIALKLISYEDIPIIGLNELIERFSKHLKRHRDEILFFWWNHVLPQQLEGEFGGKLREQLYELRYPDEEQT